MKRIELLDYGRFAAVSAVVAFHYFFNGIQGGKIASISHVPAIVEVARYGYLGVEFFFLISGYVVFFSAREKTAGEFLSARAVRLYPAFWVAVLVTALAAMAWGGDLMSVTAIQLAANLTMFPELFGQPYVDGVYWTLAYEWRFYLAVFVVLAAGLRSQLDRLFMLWPLYILVARLGGLDGLPLSDGFYGFFAAGALFALQREGKKNWFAVASLLLSLYLCLHHALVRAEELSAAVSHHISLLVVGIAVTAMFVFLQYLNSESGSTLRLRGSRLAGGLTYPVYLLHAHVGYMLLTRFGDDANRGIVYPAVIVVVFALALAVHLIVERRYSGLWRSVFGRVLGRGGDALQAAISGARQRLGRRILAFIR